MTRSELYRRATTLRWMTGIVFGACIPTAIMALYFGRWPFAIIACICAAVNYQLWATNCKIQAANAPQD